MKKPSCAPTRNTLCALAFNHPNHSPTMIDLPYPELLAQQAEICRRQRMEQWHQSHPQPPKVVEPPQGASPMKPHCQHTSSGCNAPESECSGACLKHSQEHVASSLDTSESEARPRTPPQAQPKAGHEEADILLRARFAIQHPNVPYTPLVYRDIIAGLLRLIPQHASDCAVHNAPAYPPGPCDCGAVPSLLPLPVLDRPPLRAANATD
jgi:hypothetical protein